MSRASGFAKFANAPFTRMKPNLCPFCVHLVPANDDAKWPGDEWHQCAAKQTLISNPHSEKCRCDDWFPSKGPRLLQDEIDSNIQAAREFQDYRKSQRTKRTLMQQITRGSK